MKVVKFMNFARLDSARGRGSPPRSPLDSWVYDAPSTDAIHRCAEKNGIPVGDIDEVRMLDPDFYR